MTIRLPDGPVTRGLSEEDLRLELACALYARGRVGKVAGAELAGVDFFAFQRALADHRIPVQTEETLGEEMADLEKLFPR